MNGKDILALAHEMAGLSEPAADSAVCLETENVRKLAAGLDVATAEIMIAQDCGADMVLAHHASFAPGCLEGFRDFELVADKMIALGVPSVRAYKLISAVQTRRRRGRLGNSSNYDRVPSIAKLISMPLMSLDTPVDRIGEALTEAAVEAALPKDRPAILKDILAALAQIPESVCSISPPTLYVGEDEFYAGKPAAFFSHIVAEEPELALALFEAGVGTLILPYASEAVVAAVKEQNIGNVIAMGHITADSIGMNAVLGLMDQRGVQILRLSGVIDVREGAAG